MKRVLYEDVAERHLLILAPDVALKIVDAVDRFADDGVGFVRRMLDGTDERRLYIGTCYVTFVVSGDLIRVVAVSIRD